MHKREELEELTIGTIVYRIWYPAANILNLLRDLRLLEKIGCTS